MAMGGLNGDQEVKRFENLASAQTKRDAALRRKVDQIVVGECYYLMVYKGIRLSINQPQ